MTPPSRKRRWRRALAIARVFTCADRDWRAFAVLQLNDAARMALDWAAVTEADWFHAAASLALDDMPAYWPRTTQGRTGKR